MLNKALGYLGAADHFLNQFKLWLKLKEVRIPILIFLVSRLVIIFAVWYGITLFVTSFNLKITTNAFADNLLLDPWSRWDAGFYSSIAAEGYPGKYTPFFPFFPFLIKIVNLFFHNAPLSGIVTANLSYLIGLIFLYKLTAIKFGEDCANRAVLYLSIFPTTFFFICGLSEATFFMVSVAAFYFAEKEQWFSAGLCGIFTSLTRSTGFLITPALLLIYLLKKKLNYRNIKADLVPLVLAPSGLLIFMGILYLYGNHPLDFIYAGQKGWERFFTWPWWDIARSAELLSSFPWEAFLAGNYPVRLLAGLVFVLSFLILGIITIYKIDLAYGLYSLLLLLFALSNPDKQFQLYGDLRYILVIFPIFILLGRFGKNQFLHYTLILIFIIFLAFFSVYNGLGGWIS